MIKVRAMLLGDKVLYSLWAEAAHTAVQLINYSPTTSNNNRTPHELFTSNTPDLSPLKVFGCLCFVGRDHTQRNKLESRSNLGIYFGLDNESKAYRVYLLAYKKI